MMPTSTPAPTSTPTRSPDRILWLAIALAAIGVLAYLTVIGWKSGQLWSLAYDAADSVEDAPERIRDDIAGPQSEPMEGTPFEDVQWGPGPAEVQVQVAGAVYMLLAINGWEIPDVMAFAAKEYGDKAQRRFEEDLVAMMTRAGRQPGRVVKLRVQPVQGGNPLEIEASLTWENRQALRQKRISGESGPTPQPQISADPKAIIELADLLATCDSYVVAKGSGDSLRALAQDWLAKHPRPTSNDVALGMHRLIGSTIDGHAAINIPADFNQGPWLPMLLMPLGDEAGSGIIGVLPDRSGFIGGDAMYVMSIGGAPIEQLLSRQGDLVVDGSPAIIRERSCRLLRSAAAAGIPSKDTNAIVEVADAPDAPAERWKKITLTLASRSPAYGTWPRRPTGMLDGGIAYLRLADMGDGPDFLDELRGHFRTFATADRLIIDVRGNGGGRRDALLLIASLIMPADATPVVYNASRPLRLPQDGASADAASIDRRMSERFMRRADDPAWSTAERAAIERFIATFKVTEPGITLDDSDFNPWYYGLIKPDPARSWHKPACRVIVLLDNVCFSATDAWLTAMDQIEHVTLMGRPSAGGSGLAIEHTLAGGIRVRLSSMVSFTPAGVLLDGRGVQPDVEAPPQPTDYLRGGSDSVLDRAIQRMNQPAK
ncbi:MAG: hypothetical protein IT435_06380 [Phycisphaerales bacterium]|nr:hypothetical protein [Phycisphaerales bacterium]